MLRLVSITTRKHNFSQFRFIASKAIERPHSQAFYDDKITTVSLLVIS